MLCAALNQERGCKGLGRVDGTSKPQNSIRSSRLGSRHNKDTAATLEVGVKVLCTVAIRWPVTGVDQDPVHAAPVRWTGHQTSSARHNQPRTPGYNKLRACRMLGEEGKRYQSLLVRPSMSPCPLSPLVLPVPLVDLKCHRLVAVSMCHMFCDISSLAVRPCKSDNRSCCDQHASCADRTNT